MNKTVIVLLLIGVAFGTSHHAYGIQKGENKKDLNKSLELLIHKMKRLETKKKEAEIASELVTNKLVLFLATVFPMSIVTVSCIPDVKSVWSFNVLIITLTLAGGGGFAIGYISEKVKHLCFSNSMKNKVKEQVAEQYQPKIDRLLDEINEYAASISTDKRNEGMKYLEERLKDSGETEKLSSIDNIERLQALKERLAYE